MAMKNTIILIIQIILILPLSGYAQGLDQVSTGMEQKVLKTPEGIWSYSTSNSGNKALLFIHGSNSSKKIWRNQHAISLAGYKNLFIDLLGYGESNKSEAGYTLANWIKGLHLILQQEEINEVCIVAHSNGVIFAKEYYRSYPDHVSCMILLDGMLKQMISEPVLNWMKSALDRDDYEAFMENNIKGMPVEGLSEQDAEILKNDALSTPKSVTQAELALISDSTTWQQLIIKCPVTIVHSNNPLWNEEYVEWLQTIALDHRFIEWNDAGHFIPMQYPDRLSQLIAEFLPGK